MKKKLIVGFFLFTFLFLTGQQTVKEIGQMPDVVSETSGLIFYNGKLITHNDSDNAPQLYEIDTTSLEVIRTVTLVNVENNDWEDIAQDEAYIYIGDFGNNQGSREDLAVYRIAKTDYDNSNDVAAEVITFVYEDQVGFENSGPSDWDAEALFVLNDQLIILTKQWQSEGTIAYSLSKMPGTHTARRLDSYNVEGFVTGATYNTLTENLYIIGYNRNLRPFLFLVEGANENAVFGGTVSRTNFEIGLAQVESIAYTDSNTYFFSSELFSNKSPPINLASLLFSFKVEGSVEEEPVEEEPVKEEPVEEEQEDQQEQEEEQEQEQEENQEEEDRDEVSEESEPENAEEDGILEENNGEMLLLSRSFGSGILNYRLPFEGAVFGISVFDTSGRQILNLPYRKMQNGNVDVSMLGPNVYYFSISTAKGVFTKSFVGE